MACRLADLSEGLASTTAVRCEAVDLLGQALAAVRTGRPASVQTDAQAPWGLRFRPIAGAGFHVVLEGSCYLRPPAGDPIRLAEGDVVFLRQGSAHVLCDDLTTEPIDFVPERVEEGSPIGRIVLDGPGERTLIVCGAYQLDYRPHPVLGELPDVVHLPASATHHPALRATVQQLHAELEAPSTGSTHIVSELLDLMFLYILRAWFADQPKDQATGWSAAFADPPIAQSLRAIHDDPARSWDDRGPRQRRRTVAGRVRTPVHATDGAATARLCHHLAYEHRGPTAAPDRQVHRLRCLPHRLQHRVRIRQGVQTALRRGAGHISTAEPGRLSAAQAAREVHRDRSGGNAAVMPPSRH